MQIRGGFGFDAAYMAEAARSAWADRGVTSRAEAVSWLKARRDAFVAAGTIGALKAPVGELLKFFADLVLRATVFPGEEPDVGRVGDAPEAISVKPVE